MVGVGVGRIDRDRLQQQRLSLIALIPVGQRRASPIELQAERPIDAQRLPQRARGLWLTLRLQDIAQRQQREDVLLRRGDSQRRFGRHGLAQAAQRDALQPLAAGRAGQGIRRHAQPAVDLDAAHGRRAGALAGRPAQGKDAGRTRPARQIAGALAQQQRLNQRLASLRQPHPARDVRGLGEGQQKEQQPADG